MTLATFPITFKESVAEASSGTANPSTTSITMTSGHTSANLSLAPHDANGTFASSSSSESAAFNVATNNVSGYTLNINGLDSTGQLTNTATGAAFSSIEYPTTTDAFLSTTSYNGKWGYLPSVYNSETNTAFRPAPTESGSTLNVTQCANGAPTTLCPNNQIVDNYTIGLGARVDYTKPAGTYTNTFVLATVANPVGYSVTYADGTGDSTVANLPATQSGSVTQTKVTLSSTIPTRTDYTFLYWCLGSTNNNGTTCTGTTFTAGDTNFGIDQTVENSATLYAVWSPNITIKTATGISKVTLNKKATTDAGADNIQECTSTSGCVVNGLVYGKSYTITATASTGYTFKSWSATTVTGSSIASSTTTPTTYTVGAGPSIITPAATANKYTITLNGNGATNTYTTSTKATYKSTTLAAIATLPTRSYTVSGFTVGGTNAASSTNATVSSTSILTSTYSFTGWYKESGATNKIASNAATPALSASTSYTDANSKWTSTSNQTLYAGWDNTVTGAKVTLPTITRTGSTCGWATTTGATTWTYTSGQTNVVPTENLTLYGVCRNNIALTNDGATTAGSTSATVQYNATALSTITLPQRKYTVSGFTKTDSAINSSISSTSTLTNTATFNGWYTAASGGTKIAGNTTTPALEASTTYTNADKKWTYVAASAVTLHSQFTDKAVTLPTITRTGSTCGWSTSSTATIWDSGKTSGASLTPTSNLTLYGVCRNNITLNNSGATTNGSTSATVQYNATSLSTITLPQRKYTVSGFTKTDSASDATVSSTNTLTNTATFNGWYTATSGGTKVAGNTTAPALTASTTYTNADKKWTYTTASAVTLNSQFTDNAVTLPTITKTGYTCGWATSDTATSYTYSSGQSITPTSNMTLYGVCTIKSNLTLKVSFAGSGVSSVQVRTASGTGGTLMGAVSTSGGTVSGLTYGTAYYLYPTYSTGYTLNSWAKDSGAVGTLSSTSAANPTYTIGDGTNAVTITGKLSSYTITLSKSNADAIVIDGTSYTGSSVTLTYGTHTISGTYPSGYEFSSWATSNSTNLAITSTSTASTSITVHGAATLTLTGKSSKIYMQNVTSSTCTTTARTVYDNRDEQSYVIQRLADGNCWMMTNLNLNTSNTDLTSSNTNLSTTVSKATFNGWKKTSGSGTYTSAELIPVSGTDSTSGTAYGTLYNYCAASAGTICTSSNSSNASYDICPKGWRLPTGGSSGEFQTLYNQSAYNSNANMRKSYTQGGAAFALAGRFDDSTPTDRGSYGYYWSSTRFTNTDMYYLYLSTSDVRPANNNSRDRGFSIRCVLK